MIIEPAEIKLVMKVCSTLCMKRQFSNKSCLMYKTFLNESNQMKENWKLFIKREQKEKNTRQTGLE